MLEGCQARVVQYLASVLKLLRRTEWQSVRQDSLSSADMYSHLIRVFFRRDALSPVGLERTVVHSTPEASASTEVIQPICKAAQVFLPGTRNNRTLFPWVFLSPVSLPRGIWTE